MYLCKLKIFIVSKSKAAAESIARLFSDTEPIEDCTYQLETVQFGDTCEVNEDSAVIIDRNIEYLRDYKKTHNERVAFIATPTKFVDIDGKLLSSVDDLWAVSGNQDSDEGLLKVYFYKLINSLKDKFDARRQEICFRTVIDSLPDLVWFKDNDGAHLIVNYEFCGVVEKTKKQVYKQHHNYIWDVPEDDYENGEAVCRQSEEVVVRERKTCQFEEKINTRAGMRQLVTYKSPLIDVDGTIFGTCGMGHDITDLQNITQELMIVIDSIPFGLAILDDEGKVVAINKFLKQFFPNAANSVGKSFVEWSNTLDRHKLNTIQGEDEYSIILNEIEHIMRFREQPIVDIFGENIGTIEFIRDVTMQYKFEQQNIKYANTDFLTGLNNRRSLFDYLSGLGKNIRISLIMLDLDKFKGVNDTYGHAAGDEALKITSRVLGECFKDGFIARLGGDEFLVALVGEHEMDELESRTQNLLDTLLKNYATKEEFHALSASAGIVQERLPECDIRSIENLIKRSDNALYNAKESGKARYCVNR
jgi:diguanylate cyclase (GGDEF)-like protein/PAS domain S-box-containing protein